MTAKQEEHWAVLGRRERDRQGLSLSQTPLDRKSPEEAFYSVENSIRNRRGNRYSNIMAYDRTAVLVEDKEYLNANVVVSEGGQWWVASQAPPLRALPEFLRAIHTRSASRHPLLPEGIRANASSKSAILIQLTGWEENGMIKADRYFDLRPQDGKAQAHTGAQEGLELRTVRSVAEPELCSTVTDLELSPPGGRAEDDGVYRVRHYHFTDWPDHGVPSARGVEALHALIMKVDRERQALGNCEVWVHCSAGIGRTGVFIALSALLCPPPKPAPIRTKDSLTPSPRGPLPPDVEADPVARTVDGIREWRGNLVQTTSQMMLIYDVVQRYAPGTFSSDGNQ